MKLIRKQVKTSEGKNYTNYYLVTDNGNYIAIKPAFMNDYKALYVLAEEVKNDK